MTSNRENRQSGELQGHDEVRQIYRVAGYAFLLNLFLFIMKVLLAVFSGSLAITASAIDSGTDAVASFLIY
ncbi:MAG: cobalt transporter, partial [Deltaproteobacteria bacterium]